MKALSFVVALVASVLLAVPASAQALLFEIFPTTTRDTRTFSFQLPQGRTPSIVLSDSVRFNGVPFNFTIPGRSGTESGQFDGPTFFTTMQQGGLFLARIDGAPIQFQQNRFFGEQLFTGTTAAPQFRLGEFALSTQPRNVPSDVQTFDFRLRISNVASPVPEPATWGMMLGGFGMVGAAMRRRRPAREALA